MYELDQPQTTFLVETQVDWTHVHQHVGTGNWKGNGKQKYGTQTAAGNGTETHAYGTHAQTPVGWEDWKGNGTRTHKAQHAGMGNSTYRIDQGWGTSMHSMELNMSHRPGPGLGQSIQNNSQSSVILYRHRLSVQSSHVDRTKKDHMTFYYQAL